MANCHSELDSESTSSRLEDGFRVKPGMTLNILDGFIMIFWSIKPFSKAPSCLHLFKSYVTLKNAGRIPAAQNYWLFAHFN